MQQIGKYKVIKQLGSGNFGCVYLAEDTQLQQQVAIKVFNIANADLIAQVTSTTDEPLLVLKQRFINEARILRQLSTNPHIISMYEFDELSDGTPYYVMPFISRTLVDEIGKDAFTQGMLTEIPPSDLPRRIATPQAINYLKQLSLALSAVHEHGLVHRDIKPANILINNDNRLQLSDFGIAKLPLSEHSQTGFGMGSKNYLSPEQQESAKHVQTTSDIYSVGVVAYRMFTGQLPLGRFQDPIHFAPDLPQALNDLIILALSQNSSLRPCDGTEFLAMLNQAMNKIDQTLAQERTEEGTLIWSANKASPIKEALKPLENKIVTLLEQQGEITPSDLILLQPLADIAQIDTLALNRFIEQVISQKINSSKTHGVQSDKDNDLVALIAWVNTVNKHLDCHLDNHQHYLPDILVNSLIEAGLSSTNKTTEQLAALIAAKQHKPSITKKVKSATMLFIEQIKKRPLLFLVLLTFLGITFLFQHNNSQQKLTITDDTAWQQAQYSNTAPAYQLYIKQNPRGNYIKQANQALTVLLQQKEKTKHDTLISRQKMIESTQKQLIKHGFQISQTGELDERTKHAIKAFEKSQNLLVTGNVDKLLLERLKTLTQQKDDKYWLKAQEMNNVSAYQNYIKTFPEGQYSEQASLLITQLTIENNLIKEQTEKLKAKELKQAIDRIIHELINNMVTLPATTFIMGCEQLNECKTKEMPQHSVSINTFTIMATEVTFLQWDVCVKSGACKVQPDDESWGRGDRPVIGISYYNITEEFIPWLNSVTRKKFTLPSEAQWEYAATAASEISSWGGQLNCLQARFGQFSGVCGNERKTLPVKSFKPNTFGLYDMYGNVWEWTQDCWNANYNGAPTDGSAWTSGDCKAGVIRGGSWLNQANLLRSTFRAGANRNTKNNVNGFRLVISHQQN